MTLKRVCPLEYQGAQGAFKDSKIQWILQFTLCIAFHCVLHRCESQEIHCWKLYWLHVIAKMGSFYTFKKGFVWKHKPPPRSVWSKRVPMQWCTKGWDGFYVRGHAPVCTTFVLKVSNSPCMPHTFCTIMILLQVHLWTAMDQQWLTWFMGEPTVRFSHDSWAADISQHWRFFHISWASWHWVAEQKTLEHRKFRLVQKSFPNSPALIWLLRHCWFNIDAIPQKVRKIPPPLTCSNQ